jgi:plastocyanin
MRNRVYLLLFAAVIAAGLVALHADSQSVSAPAAAASPVASPQASPIASPVGRSVSVASSVTIQMNDSGFDPVYVESTNGHDLTITLVNAGTRAHAFRIDFYNVNVNLAPGERKTIVIQSPSLGDFPYYSDAPGDSGMKGLLVFYR